MIENREIKISTDSGRGCRPIFVAENIHETKQQNVLEVINGIKNNDFNWYNLLNGTGIQISSTKNELYDP